VTPLAERIRDEIREGGAWSFARFMERALYDPDGGYYSRGGGRLGPAGDYYTASDVGRAFGGALARQIRAIDAAIGPLEPFHVVEFGAGRGLLARDILDAMAVLEPGLAARLRYVLVDRSRAMLEEAGRRAPEARATRPEALGGGHRGCVLAVELFDALPVHRVRRRAGRLVEVFVGLDGAGHLAEVERPCSPAVLALAQRYGAAAVEGTEAEVAPLAEIALEAMARCLDLGVLLVVDYGERADRLYGASRPAGSLASYSRHATNTAFLENVGEQDLTAHVNFSALEDRAATLGLELLGLTTQDRFLIANGILDVFRPATTAERRNDPLRAKARLQALQLIHPEGLGRRFKVLALGRGCRPDLSGMHDPFVQEFGPRTTSPA